MASYFRPRRGTKSVATEQLVGNSVLKAGEIFFEIPDEGQGKGQGRLIMGDGVSDYSSLKPFLAFDRSIVQDFNSEINDYEIPNSRSEILDTISNFGSTNTLANNLRNIKLSLLGNVLYTDTAINKATGGYDVLLNKSDVPNTNTFIEYTINDYRLDYYDILYFYFSASGENTYASTSVLSKLFGLNIPIVTLEYMPSVNNFPKRIMRIRYINEHKIEIEYYNQEESSSGTADVIIVGYKFSNYSEF